MWCKTPGASRRANLCDPGNINADACQVIYLFMDVPYFAFEQIARHFLVNALFVVHTNLRLPKARCVVKSVFSFHDFHIDHSTFVANPRITSGRFTVAFIKNYNVRGPTLFPSGSSVLLCPGSMLKFCLCGFSWNNSLLNIRPYFTLHQSQIIFSLSVQPKLSLNPNIAL